MSTTRNTPSESAWTPDRPIGELLLAARRDPAALDALLERCHQVLLAAAATAGPPRLRAPLGDSDLVQDALLLAWQHLPDFEGTTGPQLVRWLRAILRRVALTQARAGALLDGAAAEPPIPQTPDPNSVPPEKAAADHERAAAVRDALAGLSDDYQAAVRLRFQERLSFEEIGRRLGRSPEAVRKLVTRALRELSARLGRLGSSGI